MEGMKRKDVPAELTWDLSALCADENAASELVERAKTAMRRAGVTPRETPIRGGTDGANLTNLGVLVDLVCQER